MSPGDTGESRGAGFAWPGATPDGVTPVAGTRRDPATPAQAASLARALQALSDPARIRILSIVAAAEPEPTHLGDLVEALGRSQSTVSHHARVLVDAGFLTFERVGTWSRYHAVPEALAALASQLAPAAQPEAPREERSADAR